MLAEAVASAKIRRVGVSTPARVAGMAARLLDEGFVVDVWDCTPAVAAPVAERGATAHAGWPSASGARAVRRRS